MPKGTYQGELLIQAEAHPELLHWLDKVFAVFAHDRPLYTAVLGTAKPVHRTMVVIAIVVIVRVEDVGSESDLAIDKRCCFRLEDCGRTQWLTVKEPNGIEVAHRWRHWFTESRQIWLFKYVWPSRNHDAGLIPPVNEKQSGRGHSLHHQICRHQQPLVRKYVNIFSGYHAELCLPKDLYKLLLELDRRTEPHASWYVQRPLHHVTQAGNVTSDIHLGIGDTESSLGR